MVTSNGLKFVGHVRYNWDMIKRKVQRRVPSLNQQMDELIKFAERCDEVIMPDEHDRFRPAFIRISPEFQDADRRNG